MLGVSVIELLSGNDIINRNRSFNMLRSKVYICPVCGNIIFAGGEAVVSCCGITLPPLEAEEPDKKHGITVETVEDEYFITTCHPMTKEHYISFMAALSDDGVQLIKLYPENNGEARFKIRRIKYLYYFCNRHGLFKVKIR